MAEVPEDTVPENVGAAAIVCEEPAVHVAVDQQDRHREIERGKRQENQERVDCGHPGKQRQALGTHARRKQSSDDEELDGDGTDTNGQDATVERIAAEREIH